jgi:hypothetical protein
VKQSRRKNIKYIQFSIFVFLMKDNNKTVLEITIASTSKIITPQPVFSLEKEQKAFIINSIGKIRKYLLKFL